MTYGEIRVHPYLSGWRASCDHPDGVHGRLAFGRTPHEAVEALGVTVQELERGAMTEDCREHGHAFTKQQADGLTMWLCERCGEPRDTDESGVYGALRQLRVAVEDVAQELHKVHKSADYIHGYNKGYEDAVRESSERWKDAALQARNDLRWIDDAFAESTPVGEDGPNPPLGPGDRFADWTSPANTMRWIDEMERKDESMAHE